VYIAEMSTVSESDWESALAEYHAADAALRDAVSRAVAAREPYTYGESWRVCSDLLRDDAPSWVVRLDALLRESGDKIPMPNLRAVRYSHTNTPAATVRKAAASRRNWARKIGGAIATA
jgi:hypothetical protein